MLSIQELYNVLIETIIDRQPVKVSGDLFIVSFVNHLWDNYHIRIKTCSL